jgi:hypothetical protein
MDILAAHLLIPVGLMLGTIGYYLMIRRTALARSHLAEQRLLLQTSLSDGLVRVSRRDR